MSSINKPKQPHHFVVKTTHPTISINGEEHKYKGLKSAEHSSAAEEHFKLKILKNQDLFHAMPGIYTWIVVGDNFYAAKVISKQEIATMHRDLYRFSASESHDQTDIFAAGELKIQEDRKVEFNFLSGTYYKRITKEKTQSNISKLSDDVQKIIKSFGIDDVEYIDNRAIINVSNFRASPRSIANLNLYFNKEKKEGGKRRTKRNKTKKRYVKK